MDKVFLDLNYHTEKIRKPDLLIKKFNYSLGYLSYIRQKIKVISLHRIAINSTIEKEGISYIFYKAKKIAKFSIPFKYHNFINKLSPDYILIHGMGYGRYCYFLRKQLRKKVTIMVQVQGYASAPKGIKRVIYNWCDRYIDGYIFTGKENAKSWIESDVIDAHKVFEVMEGATDFKFDATIQRKEQSFLWVGRLDTNKDPITILKAFEAYLKKEPTATLTMVYSDTLLLDKVEAMIDESVVLKNAIRNLGRLDRDKIENLYQNHEYFVLGSHYEGSGFALMEAMACGCIPIVTNIPSFNYMTNNGACALLFEPGNEKQLCKALYKTKDIVYQKMQLEVLAQVNKKLSHKAIAKDIYEAFCYLDSKNES